MTDARAVLDEYLRAGRKVALRLATSMERVQAILPLRAESITRLTEDEEERIDAFLFRFSSLASIVQDQVGRALLLAEEEDLSRSSRKDQRLLLEKLGALDETVSFGEVAELRNHLSHSYPGDPERQADVMNTVAERSINLISAFNGMLIYARKLDVGTDLEEVTSTVQSSGLAR